ncbi:phytoene desaturase family protein [Pyxidicoccus sp. 3LG]
MTQEHHDAIVIGAGLGGLVAAVLLAKANKRVLLLEHHTIPGGYAHEFRRGRYRFDIALHALDGALPGGWSYEALKHTGVLERLPLRRLDPFYVARFPGREVVAHADLPAYERELVRHFPSEAGGIRALFEAMLRVYTQTQQLREELRDERVPRELVPVRFPEALSAQGQSWGDFARQYTRNDELLAVLSTVWGYYGLPPSRLNAATFILPWVSYHQYGAFYPAGGGMALSRALEAIFKQHGGQVRYRQTVERILVHEGRAVGVETRSGLRATADVVVSNSSVPTTLLKLVGPEHLPPGVVEALGGMTASLSSLAVYLGLKRDIRELGWNAHHELFLSDGYDIEADHAAVLRGDWERVQLGLSHHSEVDNPAPPGCSVLNLFALAPADYRNHWGTGGTQEGYQQLAEYRKLKEEAGEALLSRAERLLPGLRESIVFKEVSTPLTNVRYSLNPGGAICGFEQSMGQVYAGRPSLRSCIENLFLTGAWTTFGGGMSAAMYSGAEVGRLAVAQLEQRHVAMIQFGEWPGRRRARKTGTRMPGN